MTLTPKRTVLGLAAAAALLVGAGAFVSAQDQNTNPPPRPPMGRFGGPGGRMGGPGGPEGMLGMLPRLGRALGLTDAQRDQIKAIAATHKDEWKALADRARTAHQALRNAETADTIDETAIRQQSAAVAAVDADFSVARAHAFNEVMQVLTADQKAKLKEMKAQMEQRRQNRPAR